MLADCLPTTGSNTLGLVVLAVLFIVAGAALVRSGKSRAMLVALIIAGASFTTLQSTTKTASATCATTTTSTTIAAPSHLTVHFVGEANTTFGDLVSGNSFIICEHGTSTCVTFDGNTAPVAPGMEQNLTLSAPNVTLDVTPTAVQCSFQLWTVAPTDSQVGSASNGTNATSGSMLYSVPTGSLGTTNATFSNGDTVYAALSNEC